MVFRTSVRDASRRAQLQASRATLRELNSKPYWSEAKQVDVFNSETHSDVEFAESYGSTMVPQKQDKDDNPQQNQQQPAGAGGPGGQSGQSGPMGQQPKGDAAEAIILYLNGQRSHPVIIAIGDRRHRLLELEEGDYALHRLKDDKQQMLLHKDGTYVSTRGDKVLRMALVPKDDQQDQFQVGGGGFEGGAKPQQKQQGKTYGQKTLVPANKKSEIATEQNKTEIYHQHGGQVSSTRGGSDATIYSQGQRKYSAQSTDDHTHIRWDDHRIFNDDGGNWATSPILIKKDEHCKE